MRIGRFKSLSVREIDPDQIFLDSSNLPEHDASRFEGRVERPISYLSYAAVAVFFFFILLAFGRQLYSLQIAQGDDFANISRNNTFDESIVFAARGTVYDRNHTELIWNDLEAATSSESTTTPEFPKRKYIEKPGFSHLLGFIRYPRRDTNGTWWRIDYTPMSGIELSFNAMLQGHNGRRLIESDARHRMLRENIVEPAVNGNDMTLSVDSDLQSKLYTTIRDHIKKNGFTGGAGVIMDVTTGEVIAITSVPEYDDNAFTEGDSDAVGKAYKDESLPMLNRAIGGLYTPGSIVKPIFAIAALEEKVIDPFKVLYTNGKIEVPNKYDPTKPTVFRDWANQGVIDMRKAIAVSSDVYFYTIGGGFGDQEGLGIDRIDKYAGMFGLSSTTGFVMKGELAGIVPTPQWKLKVFGADDPWLIGNTYHTAIGQFGFQITPLQAVRYTAAIANDGYLYTPHLIASSTGEYVRLPISAKSFEVAKEGMHLAVHSNYEHATVRSLAISGIDISGKSGTAQLGNKNQWMNSWVIGYWPAKKPKYAFAVVLEKAKAGTLQGAAPAMRGFFEWLIAEHPEYANPGALSKKKKAQEAASSTPAEGDTGDQSVLPSDLETPQVINDEVLPQPETMPTTTDALPAGIPMATSSN